MITLSKIHAADEEDPVRRFGPAGCHRQDRPAPALDRYVHARSDLMIWLGDNVYADTKDDMEKHVFHSHRVTPAAHAKNTYALIDIQWHRTELDVRHLVFRCFDADRDALELTYRINFDELRFPTS